MAEELDRAPDSEEKKEAKPSSILPILEKTVGKKKSSPKPEGEGTPATMEEVDRLMDDRPEKLGTAQSGFQRGAGKDKPHACGGCWHFYASSVARHSVCELVRPDDEDQVYPVDWCRFYTADGETYPDYKQEEKK